MKKVLLFYYCLMCNGVLFAQINQIIPPSPEASSLFKFSEVPVSLYTGMVNNSVLLHNVSVKGITIPIQLNYHSRGIRVEEIAPRVGTGWNLSYGGMISRQIRGRADDGYMGFLNRTSSYYNDLFDNVTVRGYLHQDIVNHNVDETPDQFFLDMNGVSAKFIFDPSTKEVVQQKHSDIKIVPIRRNLLRFGNVIAGWVVTDDKGNRYYYGMSKDESRKAHDYDKTIYKYRMPSTTMTYELLTDDENFLDINSWPLMEVETVYNEKIEFLYEEENVMHYRRSYDQTTRTNSNPSYVDGAVCYYSYIESHQQQIKEIVYQRHKVKFFSQEEKREDLKGNAYALDRVEVFNSQDEKLKSYGFQYHYTSCIPDNNQLPILVQLEPESNKRLFLSTIQELGANGETQQPPYTFYYSSVLLPNRFSNSQDNWGFYNGKPNGHFLTFFQYGTPISRAIDTVKASAGMLMKITYPTGGSAEFTYEQNKAKAPSFINEILFQTPLQEAGEGAFLAAGKRISKIVYKDNNAEVKARLFSYVNTDEGGSSGLILGLPNFCQLLGYYQDIPFLSHASAPGSPLASLQGNAVGYSHVTEYFGDGDSNHGKIEHTFTLLEDFGDYYTFPYHLPIDNEWLRGRPLSVSVYENTGENYVLRKRTVNKYSYAGTEFPSVFNKDCQEAGATHSYTKNKTRHYLPLFIFKHDPTGPPLAITFKIYYITGGTFDLSQTEEFDYTTSREVVRKLTKYFYDYGKHYQLVKTETTNSKQNVVFNETTYPSSIEEANRNPEEQLLVEQNRIAEPLRLVTSEKNEDDEVLYELSKETTYKSYANNNLLLPEYIKEFNGTLLSGKVQYHQYDHLGNPLSFSSNDGTRTSYVWGYNFQYPIAKAENCATNEIAFTNFETPGDNIIHAGQGWGTSISSPTVFYAQFVNDAYTGKNSFNGPAISSRQLSQGDYELSFYVKGVGVLTVNNVNYPVNNTGWAKMKIPLFTITNVTIQNPDALLIDDLCLAKPASQITTYTYKPLVGMTSQTDASGRTTYYEYDGFQRLKRVKDEEGNIVKNYNYHYQTP